MHSLKPPSFLLTKKKLEAAGDIDAWMNYCCRASLKYSSMVWTVNRFNPWVRWPILLRLSFWSNWWEMKFPAEPESMRACSETQICGVRICTVVLVQLNSTHRWTWWLNRTGGEDVTFSPTVQAELVNYSPLTLCTFQMELIDLNGFWC